MPVINFSMLKITQSNYLYNFWQLSQKKVRLFVTPIYSLYISDPSRLHFFFTYTCQFFPRVPFLRCSRNSNAYFLTSLIMPSIFSDGILPVRLPGCTFARYNTS